MKKQLIQQIFDDTAYVRTGGSPEELRAAEYIRAICRGFGEEAYLEEFDLIPSPVPHSMFTAPPAAALKLPQIICRFPMSAG